MSKKFISVRIKKIRTMTDASNATRHGQREKGSFSHSAVDLKRSHLNMHFAYEPDLEELEQVETCPDYGKLLEARRAAVNARRAKNSAVGTEMLFTCSPEVLKGADGTIDLDKSRQWASDCIDLAQEKYCGMCVAARVDLDETTPHVSIFILPHYEKSYNGEKRKSTRKPKRAVSHNKVFGGREDLRMMQDWAADGLVKKGWNVERGIPVEVTRAKNFKPDGQIYRVLTVLWKQIKKRERDLDKREMVVNSWLKYFAAEIRPMEDLVPNRLMVGIRKMTSFLDENRIKPSASLNDEIKKNKRHQKPVGPAPRM